jgi:glyoxylase I family protein
MRIDHVALACRDVEALRAWYERVLDFRVVARRSPSRPDSAATTYLAGPAGGPVTFELMPDDRTAPRTREAFAPGLSHVAFQVDSLAEWEARLSASGVRWLGDAGDATGGGRVRSFLDPEGNMLQIVERPRAP